MTEAEATSAILSREQARCEALRAGDVKALAELLSDRLAFMHANGVPDTKTSLLDKMRGGALVYRRLAVSDERVTPLGEAALLHLRLSAEVSVSGTEKRIENRALLVWCREDGAWRLVAYQPTPVPASPPPAGPAEGGRSAS